MNFEDLYIGQKVKICPSGKSHWNQSGRMDRYIGHVVTIRSFIGSEIHIKEDKNDPFRRYGWCWQASDFVPVEKCIYANDNCRGTA